MNDETAEVCAGVRCRLRTFPIREDWIELLNETAKVTAGSSQIGSPRL